MNYIQADGKVTKVHLCSVIQSLGFIDIFCNFLHYSKGLTKVSKSLEIRS